MVALFLTCPEYLGHSNQVVTSLWGTFRKASKYLQERALSNVFVLKCSSFTLYVTFLITIHHGFAFNRTSLQISYVLLASKIDANANLKKKITGINHSNAKCV